MIRSKVPEEVVLQSSVENVSSLGCQVVDSDVCVIITGLESLALICVHTLLLQKTLSIVSLW